MDPALIAELLKYGPGGLIAIFAILALVAVWKLWRSSESARNTEGKLAADKLLDQTLLNVRASASSDRKDDRIAALERELDKCEREIERWRERPTGSASG